MWYGDQLTKVENKKEIDDSFMRNLHSKNFILHCTNIPL